MRPLPKSRLGLPARLDASRLACTELPPSERKEDTTAFLQRALDWLIRHGVAVERVMTDNGSSYRSGLFAQALRPAGARHVCIPASIILAFVLFWIAVCIYAWHMFSPGWKWLDPHELDDLKSILFSGAVGAIVAEGARRYLKNDESAD